MPAAKFGDQSPRFLLSQNPDDLLFGEPVPLHARSLSCGPDSSSPWRRNEGSRELAPVSTGQPDYAGRLGYIPRHRLISEEYQRIEVISGAARRRRWTTEEKLRIVDETLRSGESISVLARRHGVAPNLLYRWRRLMTEGGAVAVQADDAVTGNAELRRLEERMRELERKLGRKTLEVGILKEALARSRTKKLSLLATSPLRDDFR